MLICIYLHSDTERKVIEMEKGIVDSLNVLIIDIDDHIRKGTCNYVAYTRYIQEQKYLVVTIFHIFVQIFV